MKNEIFLVGAQKKRGNKKKRGFRIYLGD